MHKVQLFAIIAVAGLVWLGMNVTIGSLWFTLLFGVLGSTMSEKEPDIKSIVRGFLMAGMTYLLFVSKMLSGDGGDGMLTSNLFPRFTDTTEASIKAFLEMRPYSIQDASKLFIWAFISGYNKTFTQKILDKIKGSVN